MAEQLGVLDTQNKEKEDAYNIKKRTMDLLPDAENNIAKLQVGIQLLGLQVYVSRRTANLFIR